MVVAALDYRAAAVAGYLERGVAMDMVNYVIMHAAIWRRTCGG